MAEFGITHAPAGSRSRRRHDDRQADRPRGRREAGERTGVRRRCDVPTTLHQIARLESDMGRALRTMSRATSGPAREAAAENVSIIQDRIDERRGTVATAKRDGVKLWGPDDLAPGWFVVAAGGDVLPVLRVNAKTVTVPGPRAGTTRTIAYTKITDRYAPAAAAGPTEGNR